MATTATTTKHKAYRITVLEAFFAHEHVTFYDFTPSSSVRGLRFDNEPCEIELAHGYEVAQGHYDQPLVFERNATVGMILQDAIDLGIAKVAVS